MIISKEDAKIQGLKAYHTGVPCCRGHLDYRYTNTGVCYGCHREHNKKSNQDHPEAAKALSKRSYENNKIACLANSKKWQATHPEKSRAIKAAWKLRNIEVTREQARERGRKLRLNPEHRIRCAMSKGIWEFLKNGRSGKNGKSFVDLIDWTLTELQAHLEAQFHSGMTWQNYGPYWHVDHIIPQSWAEHFTMGYPLRLFWCLDNLRPMLRFDNLSRGDRATLLEVLTVAELYMHRLSVRCSLPNLGRQYQFVNMDRTHSYSRTNRSNH